MNAITPFPPAGPTKPKPLPAVNKGANTFKTRAVAQLKTRIKKYQAAHKKREAQALIDFLEWLKLSDERAARKAGGIGRR